MQGVHYVHMYENIISSNDNLNVLHLRKINL